MICCILFPVPVWDFFVLLYIRALCTSTSIHTIVWESLLYIIHVTHTGVHQDAIKRAYNDFRWFIERCVEGFTQNKNKSLNLMMWTIVPKTMFCGKCTTVSAAATKMFVQCLQQPKHKPTKDFWRQKGCSMMVKFNFFYFKFQPVFSMMVMTAFWKWCSLCT